MWVWRGRELTDARTENVAHESYQGARKQLFEAAHWDCAPLSLL